jgi:transposase
VKRYSHYVGLDVHANSISVAVAPADGGAVQSLGVVAHDVKALRRLLKKAGAINKMQICYEAGPCGYALYWELVRLGADVVVVAPTLIPQKVGDRVKTDRKDAEKLARLLRAGELTAVWVPPPEHEALRNLVRGRDAVRRDLRRAQQRLEKLLLREGCRPPLTTKGRNAGKRRVKSFGGKYMAWLKTLSFEHVGTQQTFDDYKTEVEHQMLRLQRADKRILDAVAAAPEALREVVQALQTLRGIAQTAAAIIAIEVGDFSRFDKPAKLMAWAGLVPSEYSSGGPGKSRRYGITKSGNGHLRRVLAESAWQYRHKPNGSAAINKRRLSAAAPLVAIAEKAEQRLSQRFWHLNEAGKAKHLATTAVARELLGFIWAIARQVAEVQKNKTETKARRYTLKAAA